MRAYKFRKIILFPKGKNGGNDNYVSIYLMLDIMSSLSTGKGVKAYFKFYLLDQIRENYLIVQGNTFFLIIYVLGLFIFGLRLVIM